METTRKVYRKNKFVVNLENVMKLRTLKNKSSNYERKRVEYERHIGENEQNSNKDLPIILISVT